MFHAFADGVGYEWINGLKALADREISAEELASAAVTFTVNTPATKEALFYRKMFQSHFEGEDAARTVPAGASIACSTPSALLWDASWTSRPPDPSGRAVLGVHCKSSYEEEPLRTTPAEVPGAS